ncbi:hypothetical protein CGCVW01_v014066 [Colletotrichum viniferum]|nr:hypothetical protein CGCVW01_v014066 [Colletotrichum viniferum]
MEWAKLLNHPVEKATSGDDKTIEDTTAVSALFEKFIFSVPGTKRRIFAPPLFDRKKTVGEISDSVGRTVARI